MSPDHPPPTETEPVRAAGSAEATALGIDAREAVFDRYVHDNLKRNYAAHFVHGMLGMTGFRLIFAPTFVPAYLYMLTGSPLMVGVGQSLQQAGAIFSPVIGAASIEHRHRVLPVAVNIGTMMRLSMLGLALSGWFLGGSALVVSTFIFLFLLGFFTGSQRVAFQMLLAKVIPIRKRGRLQAWRNIAGGAIAALISWWAGSALIDANLFGNGYATMFALAFILTSIGLTVLYLLLREPDSPTVRARMGILARVREFPDLLADPDYRNFLLAQLLTTAGRIAIPFCIIHAGRQLEMDGAMIGLMTLAFLGADTASNLVWGTLGDRFGFRLVFICTVVCWIAALALMIPATQTWHFLIAFSLLGAALSGYMMSATTLVLEFGGRADIPMRLALSTTAETTMAALGPFIGGVIAVAFGLIPVFGVSLVCLCAALVILVWNVREPRDLSKAA